MGYNGDCDISGEELYRRFRGGNERAFEELVALYDDELYFFIYKMVKDHHEAKHLTIDSFARLALNGGGFAGKSSVKTYLFTIGKHLAVQTIKMRKREDHISFESIIETMIGEGETPDSFIGREENKRLLHEAMNELNDEYRIVLDLLYFEDMSYMEAGESMSKSVKQIENLAYRARLSLKKKLEGKELFNI